MQDSIRVSWPFWSWSDAIKEPLIDNNFMKVFCNFMMAIDEYFVMSHRQGSTELKYHGGFRVQLYMLTSIRNR